MDLATTLEGQLIWTSADFHQPAPQVRSATEIMTRRHHHPGDTTTGQLLLIRGGGIGKRMIRVKERLWV
ncbi:hypothetical protein [Paenibacillus sp. TAF43_2]|uniref:hypothetical protein n=1 Tax=Paenibacillus sp. TAF43_2 TaxID=3233069 RepID=UPI003F9DF196